MSLDVSELWMKKQNSQFAEVLTAIDNQSTMENFLRDIMTEKEILEISARLEAAKMLANGDKYTDIAKATSLSSRTIARISEWQKNGCKGYEAALEIIGSREHHIMPARAE